MCIYYFKSVWENSTWERFRSTTIFTGYLDCYVVFCGYGYWPCLLRGCGTIVTLSLSSPATEDPNTAAAFKEGLRQSFFHWGLHVWAMYAIVALSLAFFQFRKGEPGLISATLKPIFGKKMEGPWGILVDVLAVFATTFGVATSLGFGAVQINAGLNYLFGVKIGIFSQIIIIAVVTVLFVSSAWSGLSRGIKYLSNTNLVLAVVLLLFVLILGPTLLILNMFTDSFGGYLANFVEMSFRTAPLDAGNREWLDGWTIFYWAWWIAWAPFVSMFIARVSKGRTIREFLIGVLLAPTILGRSGWRHSVQPPLICR